jgi:hypothetical protein
MMTQEEYMNVTPLRASGWTIAQIAEQIGYHPATVSGWLKGSPTLTADGLPHHMFGLSRLRSRPEQRCASVRWASTMRGNCGRACASPPPEHRRGR